MTPAAQVVGVRWIGVKHVGGTPSGRGPAVIHSLSFPGTLPFSWLSWSWKNETAPAPGSGGPPAPPQTAASSVGPAAGASTATRGRVQVTPPFVERFTQTPLVSSV